MGGFSSSRVWLIHSVLPGDSNQEREALYSHIKMCRVFKGGFRSRWREQGGLWGSLVGLPSTPWQQRGWPVPQGHPVPKGCPCHKGISVPRGHPVLDGGPVPRGHPVLHEHPLPKGCPVPRGHPIPKRHPSLDGGPLSKGFSVPTEHPVPMGCPLPVRCPVPMDVLSEMGLPSPQPHSTGHFPPCSHHGTAEHARAPRGTPSSPEGPLLTRPWPLQRLRCTPPPPGQVLWGQFTRLHQCFAAGFFGVSGRSGEPGRGGADGRFQNWGCYFVVVERK